MDEQTPLLCDRDGYPAARDQTQVRYAGLMFVSLTD